MPFRDPTNPCQLCKADLSSLGGALDTATYYCVENDEFLRGFFQLPIGACGTPLNSRGQEDGRFIALADPEAFDRVGQTSGACGCLAGTVLHAASHNALKSYDLCADKNAYEIAHGCLPCALGR
jgi:hypothetical protein